MSINSKGGPKNRRKAPNNKANTPNKGGTKVVLKCHHCQKTGHIKKDCYKLKNKDKSYFSREDSSDNSDLESLEDLNLEEEEEEIEEEPLIALEEEEIILFSKENNKK